MTLPCRPLSLVLALCAGSVLSAQDRNPGNPGNRPGGPAMLVRAADADRNGEVTAEEWQAFVGSVPVDGSGVVDAPALLARMLLPRLDRDGDGVLRRPDLEPDFANLDRDGDGRVVAEERRARRGGGGLLAAVVVEAADADGDGAVTAAEWDSHLAALGEGAVDPAVVAAWLDHATRQVDEAARSAFTPGVWLLTLKAALDRDGDGLVTAADLQQAFSGLDQDGDGTVAAAELRPRRAQNASGTRRRGGFRPVTAADRARPPLMPWQRTLDDALALVDYTGKPLLVCVNMDGEIASESLAWGRYRDPEFARLAEGFICVLASPDRRNPLDYDDRGRRIEDRKFGRVTNGEHIRIEPLLYERYFRGQRVAPRHLAVAPDGRILFDLYLLNDLSRIDEALAAHGVGEGARKLPAGALDLDTLLRFPDAGFRSQVEQRYLEGTEELRLEVTRKALQAGRMAQHPEILRLALRDPAAAVRRQAVQTMAAHPDLMPIALLPEAFAVAGSWPELTAGLLDALQARLASELPEAERPAAEALLAAMDAMAVRSRALDPAAFAAALLRAPSRPDVPLDPAELPDLDRALESLERGRAEGREDPGRDLQIAHLTLRYARIRAVEGHDPSFLLEDVRRAAHRALPDPRAHGYLTVASHMLGDMQAVRRHGLAALPALLAEAGSPLARDVLRDLADARTRQLYEAMSAGRSWPRSWAAEIRAVREALLADPAATVGDEVAFADFLEVLQAFRQQGESLQAALRRHPEAPELHERLRRQVLRDAGAQALEDAYAKLLRGPGDPATLHWFAGLASLTAAERHVQTRHPQAAEAAYGRSTALFAEAQRLRPEFASSSAHYLCLAWAGRARLQAEAGEWRDAAASIRAALVAAPGSAGMQDGLGHTPAATAARILAGLRSAGQSQQADDLQAQIEQLGITLPATGQAPR